VQDLYADVGRLQRPELEGVHLQLGVLGGEDPGDCVCLVERRTGVEGVVDFFLHQDTDKNFILLIRKIPINSPKFEFFFNAAGRVRLSMSTNTESKN
jgi:hypothetical protein